MKPTTQSNALKMAKSIIAVRQLEARIRVLQARLRGSAHGMSYGISHSETRQDLEFSLPLSDYLVEFADQNPAPELRQYQHETTDDQGVKMAGTRQYFQYPKQYVGTLPTRPPTHVWIDASTETIWAKGDPKPVAPAETPVPAQACYQYSLLSDVVWAINLL